MALATADPASRATACTRGFRNTAIATLDAAVAAAMAKGDANDLLYAVRASEDYDPGPGLETIRAPLLAVNSADDLINPPELGILERQIRRLGSPLLQGRPTCPAARHAAALQSHHCWATG